MKGDDIAARLVGYGAAVAGVVASLPQDRAGKHIADQLFRAATSGGANYAEARSAQSRRDFAHKVSLAAKEVRESLYWLGLVERTSLCSPQELVSIVAEGNELVAILMSSARTASRVGR